MIAQLAEPRSRRWTQTEYDRLAELGFLDGQQLELLDGEILVRSSGPETSGLPRLWTKEEYYRLGDLGFFEGQKVELWEGEIVVMSPQKWPHYAAVDRVSEVLRNGFGDGYWVRSQAPIDIGRVTDPEPDVSVVPGRREDYTAHPRGALLIVEISDTTLATDRGRKASLYALGGIADYWIVNLVDRQVEVYRSPRLDPAQFYGHGYGQASVCQPNTTVSPLAAPHVSISVAELLG